MIVEVRSSPVAARAHFVNRAGREFLADAALPRERSVVGNLSLTCRRTIWGLAITESEVSPNCTAIRDLARYHTACRRAAFSAPPVATRVVETIRTYMAEAVTAAANSPSLDDSLKTISENVKTLEGQFALAQAERNEQAIKEAVQALQTATRSATAAAVTLSGLNSRLQQYITDFTAVASAAKKDLEKRTSPPNEGPWDAGRLALVWGVAVAACWSQSSFLAWSAIIVADLYICVVLISAGVRGETHYTIGPKVRERLFHIMPTKTVAIFFVAGLFVALWWGFAVLYVGQIDPATMRPHTWDAARELSFLTLATFDGPSSGAGSELRALILCELGSAILLVIGIFAMAINRLSEFD